MRCDNIIRKISKDTWRMVSLTNGYLITDDKEIWQKSEARLSAHRNSESQTLSERKLSTRQIQSKQTATADKQNQLSLI